ncbi:partial Hydroxypyruvate reductase, partial [Anaerolineae bacterium]
MKSLTVLVAHIYSPQHLACLRERFPDVTFVPIPKDGTIPAGAEDAQVLLFGGMRQPDASRALNGAPQVRWIHLSSAGFDWAIVPAVHERAIQLTRSAESKKQAVAEFVIGYLFMMEKRFPVLRQNQAAHVWSRPAPELLLGKTLGIVGAGAIGGEVARLATALGMRVIGTKRTPEPLPFFERVLGPDQTDELFTVSDYLALACPLTPETHGLVGSAHLRRMKKTAYLINVARGEVVVTLDLLIALQEKWIAGACLDVFEQEPLPPDSPLWEAPNTIITPHCAFASPRNLDGALEEFMANLDRFIRGSPLQHTPKHLEL